MRLVEIEFVENCMRNSRHLGRFLEEIRLGQESRRLG